MDTIGKTRRNIHVPYILNWDEGSLHGVPCLAVYVLEDYYTQKWVLKHRIETSYLSYLEVNFGCFAIHSDSNLIIFFTVGRDKTLMSYDMDRQHIQVIHDLGHDSESSYLSYVPLYLELEGLHI
ncbi:hypothetical protein ZWY2020_027013 [Hordeum vulgare]|nr:hypothetical protein ZWY2020_027013 [Hordeum vulgare]